MNTKIAGYLMFYGNFLISMGLLGYLSNPEKAKTALMSGGTFGALSILWGVLGESGLEHLQLAFGALSILWGVLGARGVRWSLPAAWVSTGLLTLVFAWRASVGWLAVLDGKSEKIFAAVLITAMLVGSVLMLLALTQARKPVEAKKPADTAS